MPTRVEATIEDLYHVPEDGKAEIVNGELQLRSPTGDWPSSAAGETYSSLRIRCRQTGIGRAYTDNAAFVVNLPTGDLSALTLLTTLAHDRAANSSRALLSLRWKSEAKAITVRLPSAPWPPSGGTISLPGLWWYGTRTCLRMNSSECIGPVILKTPRSIAAARSPRPSLPCLPCLLGHSLLTTCSARNPSARHEPSYRARVNR
jgi:hypothetical protein